MFLTWLCSPAVADLSTVMLNAATERTKGGDTPHNNMQPSEITGMWKRIR